MDATIKSFDRETVKKVRDAIKTSLASVEKSYGITFSIGSISFDSLECSAKIEARLGTDPEEINRKIWNSSCSLVGLAPKDFGKEFFYMGEKYKVIGLALRSTKYPILVKQLSNGKTYKFPETCKIFIS